MKIVRQQYHVLWSDPLCLCLAMVEAGKVELIETVSSETGPLCTLKTIARDVFRIAKPVSVKSKRPH